MDVDLNDFIHKETSRHGKPVKLKLYHHSCSNCGSDRGYQAKSFNTKTCVDDLIKHLESKFTNGMSWNNYGLGGWEIDHVIADVKFNYSSKEDRGFKDSWALNNLQPMWYWDNRSKGAKPCPKP